MRKKRTMVFRLWLSAALLMCSTALALAQGSQTAEIPKFEFFAGYSTIGEVNSHGINFGNLSNTGDYGTNAGFETSIIRNLSKHFGLKGDFSAHFDNETGRGPITTCAPVCTTITQDVQLKTRTYNFLAGPEIKARNRTRFTPFAYALAGVAHQSARFTTLTVMGERSDTSFAMALGGGLDIRATKRVSLRGSMDYNPVFMRDSISGTRDMVRLSLGVLFH